MCSFDNPEKGAITCASMPNFGLNLNSKRSGLPLVVREEHVASRRGLWFVTEGYMASQERYSTLGRGRWYVRKGLCMLRGVYDITEGINSMLGRACT